MINNADGQQQPGHIDKGGNENCTFNVVSIVVEKFELKDTGFLHNFGEYNQLGYNNIKLFYRYV